MGQSMSILGITALILVVVLGLLVLRVKSDPMDKDSVRKYLADSSTDNKTPQPENTKLEPKA